MISPGKHAVLPLDQTGSHPAGEVAVCDNITPLLLPQKSAKLGVMEEV